MPKKVLQDITARASNLRKKRFTRKWDYGNGGGEIINTSKTKEKHKQNHVVSGDDDIFGIEEEGTLKADKNNEDTDMDYYNDEESDADVVQGGKKKYIAMIAVFMIAVFFFVSNMMASATVDIVLLQQTVMLQDEKFTVNKEAIDDTFQMQIINERQSMNVKAVNEEEVFIKASGQIIIFNEYDNSPFRLIANTRFQSPNGKVYRIASAVVIPGYTMEGNVKTPGSIEVSVMADQPGDEYNIGLVDFTIPGLKTLNDASIYEKVYARSKTSMSGGYDGIKRTARPEDVKEAEKQLEKKLLDSLTQKIKSGIGDNKVLFDDAIFTRFESKTLNADDIADVTVEGQMMLYAALFSKRDLSGSIAEEMLSSYDGAPVIDRSIENLSFVFLDRDDFDFVNDDSFTFTLSGQSHLVWETDEEKLKKELSGSKLANEDLESIVKKFPSIRKAVPNVSPFWKRTFPTDPQDIIIREVSE